ncbi:MAG: thioredoxin [Rhodoluna sp.]|nr:thioredoxin [Rhodoluna sp.]
MSQNVTASNFTEVVLNSEKPVLVDFWAEWCGPCRMVGPILDEIGAEYADKITIVKVNVDEEPHLAAEYQITGIPAMKVFQNGKIVKEMVGAKPKPALLTDLEGII